MSMKTLLLATTLAVFGTAASAVTVEFDRNGTLPFAGTGFEYGVSPADSYSSDGYAFQSSDANATMILFPEVYGSITLSTTDALYGYEIGVVKTDGGLFSLAEFEASGFGGDGYDLNIVVTGLTSGGGTLSETFALSSSTALTKLTFDPVWTNLVSLTIDGRDPDGFSDYFTIDNMVLEAVPPAPVPLPASVMMLGAAFGGLMLMRRRRGA